MTKNTGLSLLLCVLLGVWGAEAAAQEDYGLTVAGIRVTGENYRQLTDVLRWSDLLKNDGSVAFDPATRTLTLDNAYIAWTGSYFGGIHNTGDDLLTIRVKGKCTLHSRTFQSGYSVIYGGRECLIEGTAADSLAIIGSNMLAGYGGMTIRNIALDMDCYDRPLSASFNGTYRIDRATVILRQIGSWVSNCEFSFSEGWGFVYPENVVWGASDDGFGRYLDGNGEVISSPRYVDNLRDWERPGPVSAVIRSLDEPFRTYGLHVGGQQVHELNRADIPLSDGGAASYDPATQTLALRDARIYVSGADEFGIYSLLEGGLTVSLSGMNHVVSSDWTGIYAGSDLTLRGPGRLSVRGYYGIDAGPSASTIAVRDGADVSVNATSRGIMGSTNRRGTVYYTTLAVDGAGTRLSATAEEGVAAGVLADVALGPGLSIVFPEGGWFSEDSHAICDASGEPAAEVAIASAGNRYDLNGDGSVDVSDVTLLVAAVLADGAAPAAYDLNGDTGVDIGDVTELVSAVLAQ